MAPLIGGDPGPPFTIVSTEYAPRGGIYMVVRKAGGQVRKVWVPAHRASGPELEFLAAGMVKRWPDRPPDATGR